MKLASLILLGILSISCGVHAQNAGLPFYPLSNTSVTVLSSTGSGSVALFLSSAEYPTWQELITNTGTVPAFVAFGGPAVMASTTVGIPIPPGTSQLFTLNMGQEYMAVATGTSTAQVYAIPGRGMAH